MPSPVNEALDRRQGPQPTSGRLSAVTEVLAGFVDRVTFHNAENGFCVLRIKARGQRDPITVIGHAAMISAGEFVQASGRWINDRTHGVQFRASFLKATPPTTIEGIGKYLGSGMIRGIGPVYARKLVRAFGEAVFEVIAQEPGRLREVSGIGPKRASRIIAGWAEQQVIREPQNTFTNRCYWRSHNRFISAIQYEELLSSLWKSALFVVLRSKLLVSLRR